MKRSLLLLTVLLAGVFLPAGYVFAQQSPVPEIPYQSVPDFLKLPDNMYLGEVSGVAVNSKGHIFVFHRGNTTGPAYGAAAAQLLEFDPDGNFLREIGHNLYAWSFAHAVKIDRHDNIWVTDKGSDMVIKFNPEGRVVMVFGRKQEASDEGTEPLKHPKPPLPPVDGMFRQVTDVAWDAAGNTYISDGYINSRVAKVDKDGNWLKSWGEPGDQPGQFNTPHSIAADAQGQYLCRRPRQRPHPGVRHRGQVPPPDQYRRAVRSQHSSRRSATSRPRTCKGTFAPGSPWTVCITPPPHQVLYTSDAYPGRIYKLTLDGKVLGVLGSGGRQLKQFGWVHEIACPSENELYVGELLNWRVQKLILAPTK